MICTVHKDPLLTAIEILKPVANNVQVRITFNKDQRTITFTTCNENQYLQHWLKDIAIEEDADFQVGFTSFREAVKSQGKELVLVNNDNRLVIKTKNEESAVVLSSDLTAPIEMLKPNKQAECIALPTNFRCMLLQAAKCTAARGESRKQLHGINLSKDGIASADGKQLFHIELPLKLSESVTLPVAEIFKKLSDYWTTLTIWQQSDDEPHWFKINGLDFVYENKAIQGCYPNYRPVIPLSNDLNVAVIFTEPDKMKRYLKSLKSQTTCWLETNKDQVRLSPVEEEIEPQIFKAAFLTDAKVLVKAKNLLTMLEFGHTLLQFNPDGESPLLSTGNIGKYVFMPCREPQAQEENHPTTKQEKETTTMTTPTITQNTEVIDPIEGLMALFAEMKSQFSVLENRFNDVGRKIKEASMQHRQQERLYNETVRKLNKIKAAM